MGYMNSTSTLASLARGRGPWYPIYQIRSWYDRVSPVPNLPDRTSRKVGTRPGRSNLVFDNGSAVRPWPVSKSMCSKAERFRGRNSVNMSVTASPWRALDCEARPVLAANDEETRQCQDSSAFINDIVCCSLDIGGCIAAETLCILCVIS